MKRLRHVLLDAATVGSLVLCAATGVLWVRSWHVADEVAFVGAGKIAFTTVGGVLLIETCACTYMGPYDDTTQSYGYPGPYAAGRRVILRHRRADEPDDLDHQECAGSDRLGAGSHAITFETRRTWGRLPLWFVAAATGLLPGARLLRRVRRHRPIPGRCPACGYDLRATPDRCPECGAAARTSEHQGGAP